jgi:mono/diheme cytochrome c family protein
MRTVQILFLLSLALVAQALSAQEDHAEGEQIFQTVCSACHGATGGMDMAKRLAPPMIAVRMHYIDTYPDQASFVTAVADWVELQEEDRSLMPGAIRQFNLMPPLALEREQAEQVAAYIYAGDLQNPEGFQEHFEAEHGAMGNMEGMGGMGGM